MRTSNKVSLGKWGLFEVKFLNKTSRLDKYREGRGLFELERELRLSSINEYRNMANMEEIS